MWRGFCINTVITSHLGYIHGSVYTVAKMQFKRSHRLLLSIKKVLVVPVCHHAIRFFFGVHFGLALYVSLKCLLIVQCLKRVLTTLKICTKNSRRRRDYRLHRSTITFTASLMFEPARFFVIRVMAQYQFTNLFALYASTRLGKKSLCKKLRATYRFFEARCRSSGKDGFRLGVGNAVLHMFNR